jgi:hypothetical protein
MYNKEVNRLKTQQELREKEIISYFLNIDNKNDDRILLKYKRSIKNY